MSFAGSACVLCRRPLFKIHQSEKNEAADFQKPIATNEMHTFLFSSFKGLNNSKRGIDMINNNKNNKSDYLCESLVQSFHRWLVAVGLLNWQFNARSQVGRIARALRLRSTASFPTPAHSSEIKSFTLPHLCAALSCAISFFNKNGFFSDSFPWNKISSSEECNE